LVEQRTRNLKPSPPAYESTISFIERTVHENELQVADVGDPRIVEVVTFDTNRFVKTEDPIAHPFVARADALIVWRAGKILRVDDAFKGNHVRYALQTLRTCITRGESEPSKKQ
jgi:hypothetical protein